MKYVIISLQSGRLKSDEPLLLIKANPIRDIETLSGKPLPSSIHAVSPNTTHFAFMFSFDLIDTFTKALDDSKGDKNFWEPNMNDYVQDKIIDFDGNEVFVYKHYSLILNQEPKPQDILPCHYKPLVSLNEYIKSGVNSFDYMLREYDNSQKIFAFPVLISENYGSVLERCRFSQYMKEGFYLMNDIIQPEINSSEYLRHSLFCSGCNRYSTNYYVKEEKRIYYRFFNKEATYLIFNLFNEIAHPSNCSAIVMPRHSALRTERVWH